MRKFFADAAPRRTIADGSKLPANGCSAGRCATYTRWLATHHYENFNVVSWLLPKELHQHFYNVYAYCRWADDLGDEIPERARALELLDWWERELDACYEGRPAHPVFVALRETVVAKDVPKQPFADLLKAFRQDQVVKRYGTWEDVLDYCVYSANPVGRLVLYLCGYRDEERQRLSDATCTALQLANFWQDVSRDLEKGRIYIPLERAAAHGVSESDIVGKKFNEHYVALMKELIEQTRELFEKGLPLSKMVEGKLSVDLEMFSRGGLAVLDAIEAMGYDTLNRRPKVSKGKQVRLLGRAIVAQVFERGDGNRSVEDFPREGARFSVADGIRGRLRRRMRNCHAHCTDERTATFIRRFSCCRRRSATELWRCMRSCA